MYNIPNWKFGMLQAFAPTNASVEDALQYIFHFIMGIRDQDTLK